MNRLQLQKKKGLALQEEIVLLASGHASLLAQGIS